ncbi:MAG: VWA domain-containing protein [Deltaproteobacteria bacterium]|nr:VWA domain-containing protein [Deltaproteobacteria bacterium]
MFRRARAWVSCAFGVSLVTAALAQSAAADTVHGTRFATQEVSHTIEIRIDRGQALMVVQRTVRNPGPRHDQATFTITTPGNGVATRLRSLGERDGDHVWYEGELMEAEEAARKYKELTGLGGYYPKDPALLSWRSQNRLALQVFPVPPGGLKTVEYTLALPTSYRHGRYEIRLQRTGTAELPAEASLFAQHPEDGLRIDERPVLPGTRLTLDREVSLSLVPTNVPRVSGALAELRIARGRLMMHTRVQAAPRLGEVPKGARLVLLIDASRSVEPADLEASIAAARAYLASFDDAAVEVITFDREPHRLFGDFVPVAEARTRLETLQVERRNGSHFDKAFAQAAAILARAPAGAPRRIVAISDLRMRSGLTAEAVKPLAARSGAVVHIATVRSGSEGLRREDSGPWASVPRVTGGLLWTASSATDPAASAARGQVFEEWARPKRVHRFKVDAAELAQGAMAAPQVLDEGEGFEDLRIAPVNVRAIDVSGELWSFPFRLTLAPDVEETRRWAALTFGSRLQSGLTEPEMMVLARHGRAVSPVTSYLAIEPGVRPSTEGLEYGAGSGRLGSSHRTMAPQVRMGTASATSSFDHQAWLNTEIERGWKTCGGAGKGASVRLETTSREVVDVSYAAAQPPDAKLEGCLKEAVWALTLPAEFSRQFDTWTVSL